MALARVKTWSDEILYPADLNAEFNNILNNALSLISPLTGNLDLNGNSLLALAAGTAGSPSLYPTGDTNTGLYFSGADAVNLAAGGSLAAQFGATPIFAIAPEDSRTTTTALFTFRATTSGTPAAGIGTGLKFQGESADENPSDFGRIEFAASDIDAGSEDTALDVWLRVGGAALSHKYQLTSTAGASGVGVFTHANTDVRVYTLPDASDTLVGKATTDTLTNKTLTAPALNNPVVNGVSVTGTGLFLSFSSTAQTITAAGALTLAHSLGTTPLLVQVWLKNVTGELGYVTNDLVVPSNADGDGSISVGCSVVPDATNLVIRYASAATTFSVIRADNGVRAQITNANWQAIFRAWA